MQEVQFKAQFIGATFREKYQRNNKRGGLKNLRCFPVCGNGHKARGFCGQGIHFCVERVSHQVPAHAEELSCFAEFIPAASEPRFPIGSCTKESDVWRICRSTRNPLDPLMLVEEQGSDPANGKWYFEVNRKRKGWHYGWTANKHSCNTAHVLRIYVMKRDAVSESFTCVCTFASPEFVLYCRRRRRFVDENDKVVAKEDVTEQVKEESKKRARSTDCGKALQNLALMAWKAGNTTPQSDSDSETATVLMEGSPAATSLAKRRHVATEAEDLNAMAHCLVNFAQSTVNQQTQHE